MPAKNTVSLQSSAVAVIFEFEERISFAVEDKRTGTRWAEGENLFSFEFYDIGNERLRNETATGKNVIVENVAPDRFGFRINHETSGISFAVEFHLRDDRLTVSLPVHRLLEAKPEQFLLKSIEFNRNGFPVKTGEAGYLLLPHYGGTVCRFSSREARQYRNLLYLPQSQWEDAVVLPVFGALHADSAYLAIVESGEFDAEIVTSAHWGKDGINSVHPGFNFRYRRNDQIDRVDRRITYHFLAAENAGYAGMAKRYREYLIHSRGLLPLKEKISFSPEAGYICDAYGFIKIFCARKEKQPDGSSQYRVYTTFAEAGRIMKRFKEEGIEKARFILVGWNRDGHDGRFPTRFPIDRRLGGKEGLLKLIEIAGSLDYQITFHDNYSDAYLCSPDWDDSIMLKDRGGRLIPGGVWSGGQSYFPCPAEAAKRFLRRDIPLIRELGLTGWYYLDGTPRALRGCFDAGHGHPLTRRAEAEGMLEQYRLIRAYFGGCSVEMPTAFVLGEVDEVSHIPCLGLWELNPELKYFIDEQVPFFHIAIHGLVIYHLMDWNFFPRLFGSIANGILKEAEWGAMPRTEVTFRASDCHEYEKHFPYLRQEYRLLCRELGYLQLEFIEDHRQLAPKVFETTYSDGSRVMVNYSEKTWCANRTAIKPLSCRLIRRRLPARASEPDRENIRV